MREYNVGVRKQHDASSITAHSIVSNFVLVQSMSCYKLLCSVLSLTDLVAFSQSILSTSFSARIKRIKT